MKKINVLVKCMLLVMMLSVTGCNKDLQDDVNDLKDRVTTLEESVDQLQKAIDGGKLVTSVDPISATPTNPSGWMVTLSDKSQIPIYNGAKGDTGAQGLTPYVWINDAGNWATNPGPKPVNPNDASYEIKVGGNSVKAYGTSVRSKNIDGYVGFEEYDAVSGVVKNTVTTTIPFDHQNYITSIIDNGESVTMTINGVDYTLAKTGIYPMSITVIRDRDYVVKGGTVEFNIAVNPSTSKVYTKEDFELDYEVSYRYSRGVNPDFIKIKEVTPMLDIKGQYTMTLEWSAENDMFAKDAAIFIILNFTDVKGANAQVISATPVIMNEKYVSITDPNVDMMVSDIYLFTDEFYTDSVRLINYHEGYVDKVNFAITSSTADAPHVAVNSPFKRYIDSDNDKYKFTVEPILASNTIVWPSTVFSRVVNVTASVVDRGRPAIPAIPEDPTTGQPAIPGVSELAPVSINRNFKVHVYRVPTDQVIYKHDFKDYWLPNKTVNHTPTVDLKAEFEKNGYMVAGWDFAIKSQTLKKDGTVIPMENNVAATEASFTAANNFKAEYHLLPTINSGLYTIELTVTATAKTPRSAGLSPTREFKVQMTFKVVPPTFKIYLKDSHNVIKNGLDTYFTYKLADVKIEDLIQVESTRNISEAVHVAPNSAPLAYNFDLTAPIYAQGVRFNPDPVVTAPTIEEWLTQMAIRKPITVVVKLDTGQEIPVQIRCQTDESLHATQTIYVQYDRLNLNHVDAVSALFKGNYSELGRVAIDVAANNNFIPKSIANVILDPTMIQSIVFSVDGAVHALGGDNLIPPGLAGLPILQIDANTGFVTSVQGTTWQNPDVVLYQNFKVTYTDIWGNTAEKAFAVHVRSNDLPQ